MEYCVQKKTSLLCCADGGKSAILKNIFCCKGIGLIMKKQLIMQTLILIALMFLATACSDSSGPQPLPDVTAKAGFTEIEALPYRLAQIPYTSSRARIFYSFHPAREDSGSKPLFVLVNGGPGAATTDGLLSLNTAPMSSDLLRYESDPVFPNPYSWSEMGNLLYIDAPLTGYAYNFLPEGVSTPEDEFSLKNCNPFVDAGQVLRVVLRFLEDHPVIRKNPVILVGESYGGTRTTVMLNMMLFYGNYSPESQKDNVYQDETLVQEIQAHLDAVFPEKRGQTHRPEEVARQFGWHIMIEPQLTGKYQSQLTGIAYEEPGSVIYRIAEETETTYTPCPGGDPKCDPMENALNFVTETALRDMYKYDEEVTWSWVINAWSDAWLNFVSTATAMLEADMTQVTPFYAVNRVGVYKYGPKKEEIDTVQNWSGYANLSPGLKASISAFIQNREEILLKAGSAVSEAMQQGMDYVLLEEVFGELGSWDQYYTPLMNFDVYDAFYGDDALKYDVHPESPRYGRLFLENLPVVQVMITEAPLDLSVFASVLPYSFEGYQDIVTKVEVESSCLECDKSFTIWYRTDSLTGTATPEKRTVYFPYYAEAGHMVALSMPEKIRQDVALWMKN